MKKVICIAILCVSTYVIAQNSQKYIPSDASVVATVKGSNLLQLISMEELNKSFVGVNILKEVSKRNDQYATLEDLGFNLNASSHYFFQVKDSINYNAFIVPIKDSDKFDTFIEGQTRKEIIIENGIKTFKGQNETVMLWDDSVLIVVFGSLNDAYFQDEKVAARYNLDVENIYDFSDIIIAPPPPPMEEEVEEEVEVEAEIEEEVIEAEEEIEETVIESTEDYNEYDRTNTNYYKKGELVKKWSRLKALELLSLPENSSVVKNKSYLKSLDDKAEATLWVNDFGNVYSSLLGSTYYSQLTGFDLGSMYADTGMTAKLFLEKEKMQLNMTYSMSEQMAKSYKNMTSRTLNKKFLNYINEDRMVAYLSYAMDTKAMLEEYPVLMKNMYGNLPGFGEEASLGADLFSLLLDEEAVADVLKGDMLFLLSGISQKEVTYKTYEYGEDFEYKEVEKTKTETLPDFLLMASTGDSSFLNKLINYSAKKKYVTFKNGYYAVEIPESPMAVYFMIKDDIVFFGTSDTEMRKIATGTFDAKVSSKHKDMMLKNSSSVYVSAKQLMSQIPTEEMNMNAASKLKWFLDNSEDAYLTTSKMKSNSVESKMVIEVPKTEENSLKYLFNIVDIFSK